MDENPSPPANGNPDAINVSENAEPANGNAVQMNVENDPPVNLGNAAANGAPIVNAGAEGNGNVSAVVIEPGNAAQDMEQEQDEIGDEDEDDSDASEDKEEDEMDEDENEEEDLPMEEECQGSLLSPEDAARLNLRRFLHTGTTDLTFSAPGNMNELDIRSAEVVKTMLDLGLGIEVLGTVLDVHRARSAPRGDALLMTVAMATKMKGSRAMNKAARNVILEVTGDGDAKQMLMYYGLLMRAKVSKEHIPPVAEGETAEEPCFKYGGRGLRILFSKWYNSVDILDLLRVRSVNRINHRHVIRHLHIKGDTLEKEMMLAYFVWDLAKVETQFKAHLNRDLVDSQMLLLNKIEWAKKKPDNLAETRAKILDMVREDVLPFSLIPQIHWDEEGLLVSHGIRQMSMLELLEQFAMLAKKKLFRTKNQRCSKAFAEIVDSVDPKTRQHHRIQPVEVFITQRNAQNNFKRPGPMKPSEIKRKKKKRKLGEEVAEQEIPDPLVCTHVLDALMKLSMRMKDNLAPMAEKGRNVLVCVGHNRLTPKEEAKKLPRERVRRDASTKCWSDINVSHADAMAINIFSLLNAKNCSVTLARMSESKRLVTLPLKNNHEIKDIKKLVLAPVTPSVDASMNFCHPLEYLISNPDKKYDAVLCMVGRERFKFKDLERLNYLLTEVKKINPGTRFIVNVMGNRSLKSLSTDDKETLLVRGFDRKVPQMIAAFCDHMF